MERLTKHTEGGVVLIGDTTADMQAAAGMALNRLAAYEDTGLEPEEITTEPYGCAFYCNRKCNLDGDFCAEGPGCPNEIDTETAKRLLELAQAEQAGRLVVLPCKVGDEVWVIMENREAHSFVVRGISMSATCDDTVLMFGDSFLWGSSLGKIWFLSHQEAEEALRKEAENG